MKLAHNNSVSTNNCNSRMMITILTLRNVILPANGPLAIVATTTKSTQVDVLWTTVGQHYPVAEAVEKRLVALRPVCIRQYAAVRCLNPQIGKTKKKKRRMSHLTR